MGVVEVPVADEEQVLLPHQLADVGGHAGGKPALPLPVVHQLRQLAQAVPSLTAAGRRRHRRRARSPAHRRPARRVWRRKFELASILSDELRCAQNERATCCVYGCVPDIGATL